MVQYCVTVSYGKVKGRAKQFPYWQPAIYKTYQNKEGKLVWRYVQHVGTARRSPKLAKKDALEIANKHSYIYLDGVRQWRPVEK